MDDREIIKLLKSKNKLLKEYEKKILLLEKQIDYYKKEACIDALTGLYNRRVISYVSDFKCTILGDVDFFKKINDTYGHSTGDEVLKEIGNILNNFIEEDDVALRWGGEEFLLLIKNDTLEETYERAFALKDEICLLESKFGFNITMSFGVSELKDNINNAIKEADIAMYESKSKGRNRITLYKKRNFN